MLKDKLIPSEIIESKIFFIRGKKVMIDRDLARLYDVSTKVLNQAVKRKINRFPDDFMFELTTREQMELVTNCDRFETLKHSSVKAKVFTEQGIAMLSSVLNSEKAVMVNIQIMRTFTKIREMLASNKELREKIEKLECKYDQQFKIVFEAIKKLLEPPTPKEKKEFGFQAKK